MKARFIDTNVFLRFLTADLPEQAEACAELIHRLRDGREVAHVSPLAVAESIWTLERFYGLSKEEVVGKVVPLLKLRGVRVVGKALFLSALPLYVQRNVSFADAYMAVQMQQTGSEEIYSYDRDFDRLPPVRRVEP